MKLPLGVKRTGTTSRVNSTTEKKETHHPDRLGTKIVTNVDSGATFEQSTLPFGTAFGAESSGYSNQVFTSYDRSSTTGLDYANNRTYSSGQGRFTQVDPIGMSAASIGNPQSNNMYAYTQNMPTDFVDPSGLQMRYIDVRRGLGCSPGSDGKWHCIEYIDRYWYDDGTGYGGGTSGWEPMDGGSGGDGLGGAFPLANTMATLKKRCDRVSQILKPFLGFFEDLWKASGSGTNRKLERGGVVGLGEVQPGGRQVPVFATFAGKTFEGSMGPDFLPWVRGQANAMEILFWVHTHPSGTSLPSPLDNFSGKSGDKPSVSSLGIDGILIAANKLGVFNEAGNYCLFSRTGIALTPAK